LDHLQDLFGLAALFWPCESQALCTLQRQGRLLLRVCQADNVATFAREELPEALSAVASQLQVGGKVSAEVAAPVVNRVAAAAADQALHKTPPRFQQHEVNDGARLLMCVVLILLQHKEVKAAVAAAGGGTEGVLETISSIQAALIRACRRNPLATAYEAELYKQLQQQPMALSGERGDQEQKLRLHAEALIGAGPLAGSVEEAVEVLVEKLIQGEEAAQALQPRPIRDFTIRTMELSAEDLKVNAQSCHVALEEPRAFFRGHVVQDCAAATVYRSQHSYWTRPTV